MAADQEFRFIKRVTRMTGDGRLAFTIPTDLARFLHPEQRYEIIVRPVGTVIVMKR